MVKKSLNIPAFLLLTFLQHRRGCLGTHLPLFCCCWSCIDFSFFSRWIPSSCVCAHCYGSRANLGPVSYGERENLRSIQENLDWHQHWIFVWILSNIHSSTFSNKHLGNYTRKLQGIPGWYWITCWSIICRVLFLDPKIFTYQH